MLAIEAATAVEMIKNTRRLSQRILSVSFDSSSLSVIGRNRTLTWLIRDMRCESGVRKNYHQESNKQSNSTRETVGLTDQRLNFHMGQPMVTIKWSY